MEINPSYKAFSQGTREKLGESKWPALRTNIYFAPGLTLALYRILSFPDYFYSVSTDGAIRDSFGEFCPIIWNKTIIANISLLVFVSMKIGFQSIQIFLNEKYSLAFWDETCNGNSYPKFLRL